MTADNTTPSEPTPDTSLTNEVPDGTDNTQPYTPVFNNTIRTIAYVVGLTATVVGLGFITFGDPAIGAYISTAAGIVTGGLGVAYNPVRLNTK